MGFFAEIRRFPDVDKLYREINSLPEEVQVHELKKVCSKVRTAGDHNYYNELLQKFISDWKPDHSKSKFVGKNLWSGFNSYRKVRIDDKILFEKLYSSSSLGLKKSLAFQENIYPLIGKKIKSPKILKVFKGEVLSLTYSQFIKTALLPKSEVENHAIAYSNYFYDLSLKPAFHTYMNQAATYLFDFHLHHRYAQYIATAKSYFEKHQLNYIQIEQRLSKSRSVLTHGDIKDLNMFSNQVLIDWDEWGIYPAGLEQAFIFYRNILFSTDEFPNPLDWLKKYFRNTIVVNEWNLFELSFLYFLFIFSIEKIEKQQLETLESYLIKEIKKH